MILLVVFMCSVVAVVLGGAETVGDMHAFDAISAGSISWKQYCIGKGLEK